MNDQHTDAGYDAYAAGSFDTDPLFGALPGSYDYDAGYSGQYDATQWQSAAAGYDPYATQTQTQGNQQQQQQQYDTTGQWDANAWNQTGQFETAAATFGYDATGQWPAAAGYGTTSYETGSYDATAWNSAAGTATEQLTDAHQTYQADYAGHTEHVDYAPYADYSGYYSGHASIPEQFSPASEFTSHPEHIPDHVPDLVPGDAADFRPEPEAGLEVGLEAEADHRTAAPEAGSESESAADDGAYEYEYGRDREYDGDHDHEYGHDETELVAAAETVTAPAVSVAAARPVRRSGGSRGRRRTPAKRSAMLTVAVPSVCVMGVAGVAAASVTGLTGGDDKKDDKTSVTAADPATVKPVAANSKLDTQLAALSEDARDFGDRASRTQERIDLKARQEAERKKREEEAARREALRPKFALPVSQHGLSAYYGQAGVNWMSMHTGIDFPVSYGTPVMAASDGTVRTQWNSAYGNMAIVTAADGTETWYCHLSSTKIRSGSVKAGDVIAYSGNSGNSTGPHLHFEVRPGGGSAIDPLSWLRSHGLNPS
ncbi:M23 family metallopeptidase [Streptomyces sp. FIT100]|uniref:M23 family metallopeptidase n=1 Tax=Streptomyces sp. FIT100 TaxID=2837956 RepID=UPI0021C6F895|nr:M23 family metallopeptidase [Streptomyces sp. FIT100]